MSLNRIQVLLDCILSQITEYTCYYDIADMLDNVDELVIHTKHADIIGDYMNRILETASSSNGRMTDIAAVISELSAVVSILQA